MSNTSLHLAVCKKKKREKKVLALKSAESNSFGNPRHSLKSHVLATATSGQQRRLGTQAPYTCQHSGKNLENAIFYFLWIGSRPWIKNWLQTWPRLAREIDNWRCVIHPIQIERNNTLAEHIHTNNLFADMDQYTASSVEIRQCFEPAVSKSTKHCKSAHALCKSKELALPLKEKNND